MVGMADTKTLLHWENAHFDSTVGSTRTGAGFPNSESGVVRLIRITCKAMGRHGSEQSGVYQPFTTFLVKSNNIKHNPLSPFKGNRFARFKIIGNNGRHVNISSPRRMTNYN